MSIAVNNNPDKVINKLMNEPSMKDHIQFQRTGFFKSRTVTVGGEPCSLDQLITVLGEKIKNADVTKDEPNLEKLKEMLTAISDAEKADRKGFSPLFHFFSSRDKDVAKLEKTVDVKIKEHQDFKRNEAQAINAVEAFKVRNGGIEVVLDELKSPTFKGLLPHLYSTGKVIKGDIHETLPIYIDIHAENPECSMVPDANKLKVQFNIRGKDIRGNEESYEMALKDDIGVTTREVVNYLARMGIPKNVDQAGIYGQ